MHFRHAYQGDPSIIECLDLAPPAEPDNDDCDRSDTTESQSETADKEEVSLTAGLIIGFGQVVLKVQRVVAGGTHTICLLSNCAMTTT
jgi:hypothetical protein